MGLDLQRYFEKDQFAQLANVKLEEAKVGYVRARLEIEDIHLNTYKMAHGAAIFTLADTVFSIVANSFGTVAVAININISYIKAAVKGNVLIAEGREISKNKRLGNYQIDIKDQEGDMVATFQGVVYRKRDEIQLTE